MPSPRIPKVNELIRSHISQILERDLMLKGGVLVTVAKVDTTKDLRYTRVSVSVFPEQESRYILETLKKETSKLQKKLRSRLYMKPLPRLSFLLDSTEQQADAVEKILKNLF